MSWIKEPQIYARATRERSTDAMKEREFILFCDESEESGKYYSNFYGGVMVGSPEYERITRHLGRAKLDLNFHGEVKWEKVSAPYLEKYKELMRLFFREIEHCRLKVRIMFRQNAHQPIGLTGDQIEGTYFRLYYQFIKHAFGLEHAPSFKTAVTLRLYFDEFPKTREAVAQFKGFILGLNQNAGIKHAGFVISAENIAEVRSHDHVLAQCLDVVLGSMAFRLNDKHKEKPPGSSHRGKRTVAKEALYKAIVSDIRRIRSHFNIGISTGITGLADRWSAPYLHWRFVPSAVKYRQERTKGGAKSGPTQPT